MMNEQELDAFFRTVTRREQFYLNHPGMPSPSYDNLEHRQIDGRDVLCFCLPLLKEAEILIRKDSRFTDVPHYIHTNLNMNFIYSGQCHYMINSLPVSLQKGDVVIFDRNVVRRKLYAGENDIVVNISMNNEFFNNSFLRRIGEQSIISSFMIHVLSESDSHNHFMVFHARDNALISSLFRHLFIEYYSGRIYEKEMIQGYLHLIFVELLRLYHEHEDNQLVQISSGQLQNTMAILHYIEEHYRDCTLTELASSFGYHPKYLCSLLKKQTGKTFKQLQMEQRLKIAARLLSDTEEPVQAVCQNIGISNQNFFYKHFKETYHMSPNEYRTQIRQEYLMRLGH